MRFAFFIVSYSCKLRVKTYHARGTSRLNSFILHIVKVATVDASVLSEKGHSIKIAHASGYIGEKMDIFVSSKIDQKEHKYAANQNGGQHNVVSSSNLIKSLSVRLFPCFSLFALSNYCSNSCIPVCLVKLQNRNNSETVNFIIEINETKERDTVILIL